LLGDIRFSLDEGFDAGLDRLDLAVEEVEVALDAFDRGAVGNFAAAVFLLCPYLDQLIAPLGKRGQGAACGFRRRLHRRHHFASKDGEHAGVDRVGFGEPPVGSGEVAGAGGIDASKPYVGLAQCFGKFAVIDAGGLEYDEHIAASPARHSLCDGL
jgi:hypothetical protein